MTGATPVASRGSSRWAWIVVAVTGAVIIADGVLRFAFGARGSVDALSLLPAVIAFAAVGGLIASRRPRNPYGWILLAVGVGWGVSGLTADVTALAIQRGHAGGDVTAAIALAAGSLGWGLMVTFALLLYPTGALPSRRWRIVAWSAGVGLMLMTVGLAWSAWEAGAHTMVRVLREGGPVPEAGVAKILNEIGHMLIFPSMIAGAIGLFVRARRADAVQRLQLKWFAFGAAVVTASILLQLGPLGPYVAWLEIVSITIMPVVIGLAILRWRLYEIDRIVSRTVTYAALTIVLAAIYLGAVTALTALTAPVTGESPVAVAAATLIAAATFQPLRRRIQRAMDHRFNRARYDAARIVDLYRSSLRDQVDADVLAADLLRTLETTVAPKTAAVWLLPQDAARSSA